MLNPPLFKNEFYQNLTFTQNLERYPQRTEDLAHDLVFVVFSYIPGSVFVFLFSTFLRISP